MTEQILESLLKCISVFSLRWFIACNLELHQLGFTSHIMPLWAICSTKKKVNFHSIFSFIFLFSPKPLSAFSISYTHKIGIWHCAVIAVTTNCELQTVLFFYFVTVSIQYIQSYVLHVIRLYGIFDAHCSAQTFKRHTQIFLMIQKNDCASLCVHKIVHTLSLLNVECVRHWIIIFTVKKYTSVSGVHELIFYLRHETIERSGKIEINSWFVGKLHRRMWALRSLLLFFLSNFHTYT